MMNEKTNQLDYFTKQIPKLPYLVIKTLRDVGVRSSNNSSLRWNLRLKLVRSTHSIPAPAHLRGAEIMNEETNQLDYFTKQIPKLPYLVIKNTKRFRSL